MQLTQYSAFQGIVQKIDTQYNTSQGIVQKIDTLDLLIVVQVESKEKQHDQYRGKKCFTEKNRMKRIANQA